MTKNLFIKTLITASVLINVMFIGVIGGITYNKYADHKIRQGARESMSPEARNLVARTMQQNRKEIRKVMRDSKRIQDDLIKILEANEFDEVAFDATIEKLKSAQEHVAGLRIEATRSLAKGLSSSERKKLSKRLAGVFNNRRKPHHKDVRDKDVREFKDRRSKD